MSLENRPDTGNPDFMAYERGTLNNANASLLSTQLEVAVRNGDINRSEVADWLHMPWTIMKFIEGKISSTSQAGATPVPSGPDVSTADKKDFRAQIAAMLTEKGILNDLRNWAEAADRSPHDRTQWEEANPEKVDAITNAVGIIHAETIPHLETYERTERNLKAAKGLNFVENALRGTKEYVWDEFSEHPEMSVGLLIVAYVAYRSLKGTKLLKGLGFTAGGMVAYSFLRDKFGIRPVEQLADLAESVAGESAGDALRTTADTVTNAIFGNDEAGTINGYYYDKLELRRDNDRQMFNHILSQKPADLVAWYDSASAWSLNRGRATGSRVPGDVRRFVRDMQRNMDTTSHFNSMNDAERVDAMLRVTEKVFGHIATQNNESPTPDNGLKMLKLKYVNGEYFNVKWNQLRALEIYLQTEYFREDPIMQQRVHNIVMQSGDFYKNMTLMVRNASDELTMKHILFLEADPSEIEEHSSGITLDQAGAQMDAVWSTIRDDMGPKAWEDISEFLGDTVPTYWNDAWTNSIMPFLGTSADQYDAHKEVLVDWYNTDIVPLIEIAKDAGMTCIVMPIRNSKIADLLANANVPDGFLQIDIQDVKEWFDSFKTDSSSSPEETDASQSTPSSPEETDASQSTPSSPEETDASQSTPSHNPLHEIIDSPSFEIMDPPE